MNSQTRTVMIALAAGLVIGLLVEAPDLMRTASLDTFKPSDAEALGYRAGELASIPLLFAAIVIAVTSYKAGLRRSILNLLGAVFGAFAVSFVVVFAAIAVVEKIPPKELPFADAGASRTSFVKGASDSCARKQKALPENKTAPAAAIDAFCYCFGNALADVATRTEIASLEQHQAPALSFVEKINTASQKCMGLAQGRK